MGETPQVIVYGTVIIGGSVILGPSRGPSPALRAMVDRIKADVLRAVSERRYAEDLVVRRMA